MSTFDRVLVCLSVAAGVAGWSAPALALGSYPYDIQSALQLSYEPPCSVCHLHANIGPGTVRTPFAINMKAHGLIAGDDSSVWDAVTALAAEKADSDGDGIPDANELRAGTDPNSPANEKLSTSGDPQYGCAGSTERTGRQLGGFAPFFGLGFGAWLRRRARSGNAAARRGATPDWPRSSTGGDPMDVIVARCCGLEERKASRHVESQDPLHPWVPFRR